MAQYCNLKSDLKVCSIFHNIGIEDYFIMLGERKKGIFDILQIDGCEGYPLKYTSTWEKNIVLFDGAKNELYNSVDKPLILFKDDKRIEVNYRNRAYKLLYDESDRVYPQGTRVEIVDPTSKFCQEKGVVADVIDDDEFLEKNSFLPRYRILLDSKQSVFMDHYQISRLDGHC